MFLKEQNKEITYKKYLQEIRELWIEKIDVTVCVQALHSVVKKLVDRGIPIEYLLFIVKYASEGKINLRHPQGIIYFTDKQEIQDAYKKNNIKYVNVGNFKAQDVEGTSFKTNNKETGFQSILGGNK